MTAIRTCSWAEIHQPVGSSHDVAIMFHHNHRATSIPQLEQRTQQPLSISRMQPGGGFVEHKMSTIQL